MHKSFIFKYKFHYLLTLAGFIVWMLFFDEKDYFTQTKRKQELEKLDQKIDYYRNEITQTRKQVEALDKDPAMLEKFAREKYLMKRDNEEVFIIELPEDTVKN